MSLGFISPDPTVQKCWVLDGCDLPKLHSTLILKVNEIAASDLRLFSLSNITLTDMPRKMDYLINNIF